MMLDPDHCYAALRARDARFDGTFFVGVSSTRIYCRPICAVRTPGRERCSFFPSAASAEAAGFRPCLRCRPELAPGTAPVDAVQRHADLVLRRIQSGQMASGGLEALAIELGVSDRQLRRCVQRSFGVSPRALLQTQRLLLAKQLLTDTALPVTEVAFASGFSSLRRFNATFRSQYRLQPSQLRGQAGAPAPESLRLQLAYRPPLAWESLLRFLVARGAPGTEQIEAGQYRRTVRLAGQRGWIGAQALSPGVLALEVSLTLLPVLPQLLPALRRLFDLDAHPQLIAGQLAADPRLQPLVLATPGLRVPGALDGFELALRAVLGQQVSVRAATTVYGRIVARFGEALTTPHFGLNRLPPTAEVLAEVPVQALLDLGLTRARAGTVTRLARHCADGVLQLHPGSALERTRAALLDIPGIGPWTTEYIAMRALGDPDAFPASDLALMKAAGGISPSALQKMSAAWRPWRAYAAMYAWTAAAGGG